ncbi:MAG: hypothetical protein QM714_17580 [Nocardioides sp.]|uniref:hypothetical protein n=1 Tax=Nocardioides sp. TaxID=35761 RepID=UPI0039E34E47
MITSLAPGSTLGVLAKQEIRNYLDHKLFWFGAALTLLLAALMLAGIGLDGGSSGSYMIVPGALLGVLGLVVMNGLTHRSDRAAAAAGAVAVPERTRTLALAAAVVVPASVALVAWVAAVITWYVHPPTDDVMPPGISNAFVHAMQFGDGVMSAVGGPLLGLLLARYLPKRGVAVIASVLLVIVTILLQGGLIGLQPYRVFWVWTYFLSQVALHDGEFTGAMTAGAGPDYEWHMGTYPGNPFIWLVYLIVLCVLGVVIAVYHDPESDRVQLRRVALGLVAAAVVLGVLAMTVGYTDQVVNPAICGFC